MLKEISLSNCLIKREFGVNPKRSRHCDSWFLVFATGNLLGKAQEMIMLKSGYLLIFRRILAKDKKNL